jgi:hypothetical protein
MGREYTMSTGMKIFYILLAAGMFVFAIVLLKMPQDQPALLLVPLIFIAFAALIIANALRRKVIIYDDSIVCINLFSRKEMAFSDITGCRIGQKVLVLESNSGEKITISNYSDLSDSSELATWIKDNFKDLDAIDLKQDEEKVLQDATLGFSLEDRERKLKTAKQVALVYNIIGAVAAFGLVILGKGYAITIIGLLYPLLGLIIMKFSKGLIKFTGNSKRSVTPFLLLGFMIPVITMLIVVITDYQIFQFYNLWLPIGGVTALISALLYFIGLNRSIDGIRAQIIIMIIMAAIYGFGSVISINCAFDKSEPTIYKAEILGHRIESGKHTSYLLTLTEWGPMHEQKEEDVGRHLYNEVTIGDTVKIYFKPGLLKTPWYQVGR